MTRRSALRRRRDDDRGAVLLLVALLLTIFCICAAFVVDLGYARQVARQLQATTDAASLAAAADLPRNPAEASVPTYEDAARATAMEYVVENAFVGAPPSTPTCTSGVDTCTASVNGVDIVVTTPYTGIPSIQSYSLVYVRTCRDNPSFLAGTFGEEAPRVCREAVARRRNATGGYNVGLVALDETSCAAMQFRGDSETVLSSNGAVVVNSECRDDPGALDASGANWSLTTNFLGVVGSATLDPCEPPASTSCTGTIPTESIPHFDDPLGLSPPSPLPASSSTQCPSSGFSGSGVFVMEPGRYTTKCDFNGTRQYIFRPGTYYFDQGYRSAGSATLVCSNTSSTYPLPPADSCTGVTFIVGDGPTGSDWPCGSSISSPDTGPCDFIMQGSGRVHLPAPSTGPYAGVSIYQVSCGPSVIDGASDFDIGTLYAPCAPMYFTGQAGGEEVNVTGIVVTLRANIGGSFNLDINVPTDGAEVVAPDEVGLEQ